MDATSVLMPALPQQVTFPPTAEFGELPCILETGEGACQADVGIVQAGGQAFVVLGIECFDELVGRRDTVFRAHRFSGVDWP